MSWFGKLFGNRGGATKPSFSQYASEVHIPAGSDGAAVFGDQVRRKDWAEGILRSQGVPLNPNLPVIEGEAETRVRDASEIADRLLALTIAAVKGEGLEQETVEQVVAERDVRHLFTPAEAEFISNTSPSMHERVQFSWRYEAAWVLLWALKYVDGPLSFPGQTCDVPLLAATVRDEANLGGRGVQSTNDILNEADLIYRYHWAVRQSGLDGNPAPAGLDAGVVMERHHAMNWLVKYFDQEWDDVSTDT